MNNTQKWGAFAGAFVAAVAAFMIANPTMMANLVQTVAGWIGGPSDTPPPPPPERPHACGSPDTRPASEVWVTESWRLFGEAERLFEENDNAGAAEKLRSTIANIEACLPAFLPAAQRIQDTTRAPPEEGAVPDGPRREAVFANGPLNDVGVSYWILGRAHQQLGQPTEARAAYDSCKQLTHARAWDPRQESFWATATSCSAWLNALGQ